MTEHLGFRGGGGFVCVQCSMKEFVEILERGDDPLLVRPAPIVLEGSIEDHMRLVHPDLEATQRERADLEARARSGFEALMRRRAAGVENAKNN